MCHSLTHSFLLGIHTQFMTNMKFSIECLRRLCCCHFITITPPTPPPTPPSCPHVPNPPGPKSMLALLWRLQWPCSCWVWSWHCSGASPATGGELSCVAMATACYPQPTMKLCNALMHAQPQSEYCMYPVCTYVVEA